MYFYMIRCKVIATYKQTFMGCETIDISMCKTHGVRPNFM